MDFMWLYSLCQCILSVALIVVSIRLWLAIGSSSSSSSKANNQEGTQNVRHQPGSVSYCLLLCLAWLGAIGGALEVPGKVLLNLRIPQCLYTCITLVCLPLLVRQFTMILLILLTLDSFLRHHLAHRYSSFVTRQRALCVIMLCWVGSVLASFAQFIGSDVFNTWRNGDGSPDTTGLGLNDNETTPSPHPTRSPFPASHHDGREVIAKFLPYGGFLSKFYVEDKRNFTYAEIHSSHWGVCAPDLVLTPQFLVYVHGMTVFILPILCLLAIYLCLLCLKSRQVAVNHEDRLKQISCQLRSLTLSLSLLVALCSPFHIIHALMLLSPNTKIPAWVKAVAAFLFQLYSLVPQLLFTPQWQRAVEERAVLPLPVGNFSPVESGKSKGKLVTMALCEAVQTGQWVSAKHSLRSKVCPEV